MRHGCLADYSFRLTLDGQPKPSRRLLRAFPARAVTRARISPSPGPPPKFCPGPPGRARPPDRVAKADRRDFPARPRHRLEVAHRGAETVRRVTRPSRGCSRACQVPGLAVTGSPTRTSSLDSDLRGGSAHEPLNRRSLVRWETVTASGTCFPWGRTCPEDRAFPYHPRVACPG